MTLKDIAIASDLQNCQMGLVCWCPYPPHNVPFWRHKSSLLEAIYLTLKFAQTDFTAEWLVVGADLAAILRTFTRFKEQVPVECEGAITYIGTLGNIKVYFNPTLEGNWWRAGCGFSAAQGYVMKYEPGISTKEADQELEGVEKVNGILNKIVSPASESSQSSC